MFPAPGRARDVSDPPPQLRPRSRRQTPGVGEGQLPPAPSRSRRQLTALAAGPAQLGQVTRWCPFSGLRVQGSQRVRLVPSRRPPPARCLTDCCGSNRRTQFRSGVRGSSRLSRRSNEARGRSNVAFIPASLNTTHTCSGTHGRYQVRAAGGGHARPAQRVA